MSSTGRGPRRGGPDDVFPTPSWCVERLLEAWRPRSLCSGAYLLEPGAGDGAIIRAANHVLDDQNWIAVESRATCVSSLQEAGANPVIADFLTWEPTNPDIRANTLGGIANPPYSLLEPFIRRAAAVCPRAEMAYLVRLGFLASAQRVALWRDLGMPSVFVLPNRPSFTANGATDSSDYAWIIVGDDAAGVTAGRFRVLAETPLETRRPKKPRRIA